MPWLKLTEFRIYDVPKPGGSKRVFRMKAGKSIVTDDCKTVGVWREAVKSAAREAYDGPVVLGPLRLAVVFYMTRPIGHWGTGRNAETLKRSSPPFPVTRPDSTKLLRSTEDCLSGLIWRDDAQIVNTIVGKRYHSLHGRPGARIIVWTYGGEVDDRGSEGVDG